MFSKLFAVASLALLAVATPTPGGSDSGSLMCCDKVYSYNEAQGIAGLLDGIPVSVLLDNVGQDIASGCIVRRSLGFFFRSASSQKKFPEHPWQSVQQRQDGSQLQLCR